MLLTAYFSENGSPKTGLSPTIDVIDLSDGSVAINDGEMTDRGSGFYTYDFAGYDASKDYGFICDSITLVGSERYAIAEIESYLGTDGNIMISTNAQDLSTTLDVNTKALGGTVQSATDLKDFADEGYDPATNKVEGIKLVDTTTAVTNDVGITQTGADKVWSTAARTLTSFGTLIADIWSYVTRTLTAIPTGGATEAKQDTAQNDLDIITGSDGATLANDAITSAKYDESTAFPIKSDDSGATEIARTGADGDTLETLSDQSDAIQAKTDNLPSGIAKNVALPNFRFLMVDSTDHVTGKTGLTVTAQISKDDGAFAGSSNSVTEVSGGIYSIDWIQAEMNVDTATFKFTATGADQRTVTIFTS